MKKIDVLLGSKSYTIYINNNILGEIHNILIEEKPNKILLISQYNIMELIGFDLIEKLKSENFDIDFITLPVGEAAKSINEFNRAISQMIELNCDRSTTIISLGGGVVGDVAGFIASTFMRGVKYYQIPTTLLSMVDSSIGGKTGINISEGKNLIGTIYQPKGVIIDPSLLKTLPKEEVISGIGEIIKYGAISDISFLNSINKWLDNIDDFPYEEAIHKSVMIKAKIVSNDERENSLRKILNFGHTMGHAFEAYYGYNKLRHGEAISYGMLCSTSISMQTNYLSSDEGSFLIGIIKKLPLKKLNPPTIDILMPYIMNDKKVFNNKLYFIVLNSLGNGIVTDKVTKKMIEKSLKALA